jgi:dipeptide/tripeptide permease
VKQREPFPRVPYQPTYPFRGVVGLALLAAIFFVAHEVGLWWMLAAGAAGFLFFVVVAVAVGVKRGAREARAGGPPEPPLELPIRTDRRWPTRFLGYAIQLISDPVALVVCALFVPGVSLNWIGLLIAVALISVPPIAIGEYLDRPRVRYTEREPHLGRLTTVIFLFLFWMVLAPAVADEVTPDFNIGGVWQYVVLLALLYLTGFAAGRFVQTGTALLARGR